MRKNKYIRCENCKKIIKLGPDNFFLHNGKFYCDDLECAKNGDQ